MVRRDQHLAQVVVGKALELLVRDAIQAQIAEVAVEAGLHLLLWLEAPVQPVPYDQVGPLLALGLVRRRRGRGQVAPVRASLAPRALPRAHAPFALRVGLRDLLNAEEDGAEV